MNSIMAGILLLPLLIPSPKKINGPKLKCKDFIEVLHVASSSLSHKLLIKRSDATPDHVYSCIGRRDLKGNKLYGVSHKNALKKDQVILIPKSLFLAFSPWIAEYQYSFGSIDSSGPERKAEVVGQTFFVRYSKTVKNKYDAIFWLGMNKLDAKGDGNSAKYKSASKAAPVGQIRFKFNYNANWSYYAFARIDRYSISGIDSVGSGIQTFTYKIDNGVGVEKSWGERLVSRLDTSIVYPSGNDTNSIKSGLEAAVEIEYLWRKWFVNYRVNYLNLTTDSGSEIGHFQYFKLGYRF